MTPRKIATFAIGPIGAALLGLVTIPIITWFFSQEDVGRIGMLQVTISFTTLFFGLGLDQAYVREFHEVENQPAILKAAILPGFILLMVVLAALLMAGGHLSDWLFGVSQWHLSLLVAVVVLANFLSRFLSLVLRMNERGLAFSMSQVLPKLVLLMVIVGYVIASVDKNLTNLIIAYVVSISSICLVFAWNTRTEWLSAVHQVLDPAQLKSMLLFGLPLVLGAVAFWGLTALDKVFLRILSSYEELGVYSVAVNFAAAATVLQSIFSTVWAPTVYKWASLGEGLENVDRVIRYVLLCVVILFSIAGLFSWVIQFLLPDNYRSVQWTVISCLGFPLLYTLSEATKVGIGITRRSEFAMLAAMIAVGANVVGNWLLIPEFGSAGAAVSTCGAFFFFLILRTEFSSYFWRSPPRGLLYPYTAIVVLGAIVNTLVGEELGWLSFGYWAMVLLSTLCFFRGDLGDISGWITNRVSNARRENR